MSKAIDMVGKRYGRLVVLKRDGNSSNGGARWLCQCDCGVVCTETGLPYSSLRASKRNHTGVVGVSLDRKTGKWFARLMIHNRYVLLKSFDQFEEAVAVRKTAEKKYLYK